MRSILMTIAIFLIVVQPTLAVELIVESKNLGIDDHEFTVNITLTKAVNGISGYNVSLTIDKPSVAQIKSIKFPDWATLNDYSKTSNKIWIKALDLNENIQNQFELKVGDNVTILNKKFTVQGIILSVPNLDGAMIFGEFAIISKNEFEKFNLTSAGSFLDYDYRLKMNDNENTQAQIQKIKSFINNLNKFIITKVQHHCCLLLK